jgi:predicted ATPase
MGANAKWMRCSMRSRGPAAAAGRPSLLLVEGYAGVGKTALIEQLYRPIVRREGTFIAGKFDQVVRGGYPSAR